MKNLSGIAKITETFIKNSALSWVIIFAVIIFGIFSYIKTPKLYDPEINLPTINVKILHPGKTAQEIETFVTEEIEASFRSLENIDEINTKSSHLGITNITVKFNEKEDITSAKSKIIFKLTEHSDLLLKNNLAPPVITEITSDNIPILEIGFYSDNLNQNEIREKILQLRKGIRKITNTSYVTIYGGEKKALKIFPNFEKMKIREVGINELFGAIKSNNLRLPVGLLRNSQRYIEMEVQGTFESAEEIKNVFIRPNLKIGDIAEIREDFSEKKSLTGIFKNGKFKESVFLSIAKVKNSNIIVVSKDVQEFVDKELKKDFYKNINYEVFRDSGDLSMEKTSELSTNLFFSIVIVFVVISLFIGRKPGMIVVSLIPLTIFGAFIIGFMAGETINRVSLFAFVLSLGLLTDAGTIITETALHHFHSGKNKLESILLSIQNNGKALIISTISICVIFLSLVFITGTMHYYIWPVTFFMPVLLILSLIFALIIIPFLFNFIIKDGEKNKSEFIDKVIKKYINGLKFILAKKKRQIIFIFSIIILLGSSFFALENFVKRTNIPEDNLRQFHIYIDAPVGTDIDKTTEITNHVANLISKTPEILSQQIYVGTAPIIDSGGLSRSSLSRNKLSQSTIKINIGGKNSRKKESPEILRSVRNILQNDDYIQEAKNNGAFIKVIIDPSSIPVDSPFLLRIKGENREIRWQIAEDLKRILNSWGGISHIDSSNKEAIPKFILKIDHEKSLKNSVESDLVIKTLLSVLGINSFDEYQLPNLPETSFIEIQVPKNDRSKLFDLTQIYIKSLSGEMVPLSSIIEVIETRNEPNRLRHNSESVTKIFAEIHNITLVDSVEFMDKFLKNYELPNGIKLLKSDKYGHSFINENGDIYKIEWGGEWEDKLNLNADLLKSFGVALFLMFLLLIYKFNNLKIPLIIMSVLLIGLIGVFWGFSLLWSVSEIYMSSMALIGIIALAGIVSNNSIVFFEQLGQIREKEPKKELSKTLIEAGQMRFKSMVLTSSTTILGVLTIVNDPAWGGMAWTVVFGLIATTLIAVYWLSVSYNLLSGGRKL